MGVCGLIVPISAYVPISLLQYACVYVTGPITYMGHMYTYMHYTHTWCVGRCSFCCI